MTREDILRMAREAWGEGKEYCFTGPEYWPEVEDMFERFAALVAAAEREECAAMFDNHNVWDEEVGERIRARRSNESVSDSSFG